jgi:hypothetical protein
MARNYPLEQLFGPIFRGLPRTLTGGDGAFAGRTTISAGSLQQVISTTAVESDSIILLTAHTSVASNGFGSVCVKSITDGTSFTVGFTGNLAATGDIAVMWRIIGQ